MEHPLSPTAQKLLDDFTRDFPEAGRYMATLPAFRKLLNVSVEENPKITYQGYTEDEKPEKGSTPLTKENTIYMPKNVQWTGPSLEAQQKAISHFAFEVQNARKAAEFEHISQKTQAEVKSAVDANAPVDGPRIKSIGAAYARDIVTREVLNSLRSARVRFRRQSLKLIPPQ